MAAVRSRKGLAGSRRRLQDEGEEEDGFADIHSDTQSEGSVMTDVEDLDTSDVSDVDESEEHELAKQVPAGSNEEAQHGAATELGHDVVDSAVSTGKSATATFNSTADTEAMMNGLNLDEGAQEQETIHFEDSMKLANEPDQGPPASAPQVGKKRETLGERRAREHEEYKQKREADPAFVPTRGGFFMHDQRSSNFGPGMQIQMGRGRGRSGPTGILGAVK